MYKPILDKVKMAIETYGKDNGYTMIFDSSAGAILHATETDNLINPLKSKIGRSIRNAMAIKKGVFLLRLPFFI